LALAFAVASCGGGSSSGEEGETQPSGPGPGPETSGKIVTDLVVLKHPNMYSFEGAAPDLSGLQVAVYWTEGGKTEVSIEDGSKFYTIPSVARLPGRGTGQTTFAVLPSCTSLSDYGDYSLYFDDGTYSSVAKPQNVYIPAVVAMVWDGSPGSLFSVNNTATSDPIISLKGGPIPAIYEDRPFDIKGITIRASYMTIPSSTSLTARMKGSVTTTAISDLGVFPVDYGYSVAEMGKAWEKFDGGFQEKAVSKNETVWRVNRADAPNTDINSKLEYIPVLNFPNQRIGVSVGSFYFIDRIEYVAGSAKDLRFFLADEEDLRSQWSARLDPIDWLAEAKSSGALFKVIYYVGERNKEIPDDVRTIGMNEYIKAMYTVDTAGKPKATKPKVVGYPGAVPTFPLQDSVINDWNASIAFYYYHPGIYGTWGQGDFLVSGGLPNALADAALIPITELGLVYQFSSVDKVRIKNTGGDDRLPQVFVQTTANNRTTLANLVASTKQYYDIVFWYADPNDGTKRVNTKDILNWKKDVKDKSVPWSTTNVIGTVPDRTLEGGESGDFDVRIALPKSEGGTDDVTFEYEVLP